MIWVTLKSLQILYIIISGIEASRFIVHFVVTIISILLVKILEIVHSSVGYKAKNERGLCDKDSIHEFYISEKIHRKQSIVFMHFVQGFIEKDGITML